MVKLAVPGIPGISVVLRRSARARRMSLRVSNLNGAVTLTLPRGVSEKAARGFLDQKRGWLQSAVAEVPPRLRVSEASVLPFQGQVRAIAVAPVRAVGLSSDGVDLLVPQSARHPNRAIRAWLRVMARDAFAQASDKYSRVLGRDYAGLTLRDTRSRWGSCSAAGALMYSWRLIMAPPEVLDYVAAHEVAHLAEMNHGRAFWTLVGDLCPDYCDHRAWLRKNGDDLHYLDFGD